MDPIAENPEYPRVIYAGDRGLMVLFGDSLDLAINNAAHAFDVMLRQKQLPWIDEITPAICSVLIRYDPMRMAPVRAHEWVKAQALGRNWLLSPPNPDRRRWKLPAHYGGDSGPDFARVVDTLDLPEEQVIAQHSQSTLRILMLGFALGCAYLGSLPENWDLPRLDYVKPEVPAGSLSVAVRQTVLFATAIPTGWQTIARTPFRSFSPHHEPYFHLAPGDEINFEPIDEKTFSTLSHEVRNGKQIVSPQRVNG